MSPNPPFEDYAGTTTQAQQQFQTQSTLSMQVTEPAIAFVQPSARIAVSSSSGQDVSYIARQMDEAMAEATAHVYAGESRLKENNILEAIREFELARQLVERDIDPSLQYIQQIPKVQGGFNVLSDQRIQSMHTQRQTILGRISTSYDFEALYQRQHNQQRVNALRTQNRPVFKPLVVEPAAVSYVTSNEPQIPESDGYVVIEDLLLMVPVQDVELYIDKFQQHQAMFHSYLLRTRQYYPVVSSILSSHNVPERLAYVGLIASGYQPAVKDKASGKVGLWQLSTDVARRYGLQVNSKKDERKDIEASTSAFARYIRDLERRFGGWDLAIMAYEMGEQELQRAINRAGAYNVEEVRAYVGKSSPEGAFLPKLAAALLIADAPEAFGFVSANVSRISGSNASPQLVPVNVELGEPPVTTILSQ